MYVAASQQRAAIGMASVRYNKLQSICMLWHQQANKLTSWNQPATLSHRIKAWQTEPITLTTLHYYTWWLSKALTYTRSPSQATAAPPPTDERDGQDRRQADPLGRYVGRYVCMSRSHLKCIHHNISSATANDLQISSLSVLSWGFILQSVIRYSMSHICFPLIYNHRIRTSSNFHMQARCTMSEKKVTRYNSNLSHHQ